MRARLDVARAWQATHERPSFYAGVAKGAQVAAWKQAARAELAALKVFVHFCTGALIHKPCFLGGRGGRAASF